MSGLIFELELNVLKVNTLADINSETKKIVMLVCKTKINMIGIDRQGGGQIRPTIVKHKYFC